MSDEVFTALIILVLLAIAWGCWQMGKHLYNIFQIAKSLKGLARAMQEAEAKKQEAQRRAANP